MSSYFMAMMLLSGGSFIHSKSAAPEMRPDSVVADSGWLWLARAAFFMWLGLIVWGFMTYHWSQPLAAILASLAVNALIAMRGPQRSWPGLSILFCIVGLMAGATLLLG